ncbi:MAG: ASCH domain-containing protein [Bacilli bacterium]|jgi:ASC-1-like (ASCH) protein
MNHWMKIRTPFFEKIARDQKHLEVRLFDAKRRAFNRGDIITFTDEETGKSLDVQIEDLYIYPNFRALFSKFPSEQFGFEKNATIDAMVEYMYTIYQPWDERRYGVVAIKLSLLKKRRNNDASSFD